MPLIVGKIEFGKTRGGYEVIRNAGSGKINMIITPWGLLRVGGFAKVVPNGNIVNVIEIREPYCGNCTTADVVRVADDHEPFTLKMKELIPYYTN